MIEKDDTINQLIEELKEMLSPIQYEMELKKNFASAPVGMVVGNPRSGTTLFMQWVAGLDCFSYPTNLMARFAYAPYIGAMIQKMLFDKKFDPLNELNISTDSRQYESNLGKSSGILEPNEFQHFFRNYMDGFFPSYVSDKEYDKINFDSMKRRFDSIYSVLKKPFITKAMMFQYNLGSLYASMPNLIFFHIKREPIYIMQSILIARKKYYGNVDTWWSVKPREYDRLKSMSVYEQIAGQVFYTEKAIEKGLNEIPENNKVIVEYEIFCSKPEIYYSELVKKYAKLGFSLPDNCEYISFESRNEKTLDESELHKLNKAYEKFKNKILI